MTNETSVKTRFTPGPWFPQEGSRDWDENRPIFGLGGVAFVASVQQWRDHPETRDANANLIAAAPDLYEALKAITDCYGVGWRDARAFLAAVHDFMVEGRTALSKARGE